MAEARNYEEYRTKVLDKLGVEYESEDIQNFERWRLKVLKGLKDLITSDAVNEAISSWIDDHPEAVSTVEDGSISKQKLSSSLQVLCNIADSSVYPNYYIKGKTATVYDADNTDISSLLNTLLADNNITSVTVKEGNYTFSETVVVPENKTLVLSGDYHNQGEVPSIITPDKNGVVLIKLNSKSGLIGGVFKLGGYENVTAIEIDCYNQGVANAYVKNTKVIGGKYTHSILTQTAIKIECDDLSQRITEQGYLVFCEFDAYIEAVAYGYHFHRQRADGTSNGVWLTNNTIKGYIFYCTRYVWFDFATGIYANNEGRISAICQSGTRISGEGNYPAINLKGIGLIVDGNLWDFYEDYQYPAVLIESSASNCMVLSRGSVVNESTIESDNLTNSILAQNNIRFSPIISLSPTAEANGYITDLVSECYVFGNIIILHARFKIANTIPAQTHIFNITGDSYKYPIFADIMNGDNRTNMGGTLIDRNVGHVVTTMKEIASDTAWMHFNAIAVSNRA